MGCLIGKKLLLLENKKIEEWVYTTECETCELAQFCDWESPFVFQEGYKRE